jgi:hypothetical protein
MIHSEQKQVIQEPTSNCLTAELHIANVPEGLTGKQPTGYLRTNLLLNSKVTHCKHA